MGNLGHQQLHISFFPFMAHGHVIPTVDMAKLFAFRGHKTTIITTPANEPLISKTIQRTKDLGFDINIQILKFPSVEAGLPEGCENLDSVISYDNSQDIMDRFWLATAKLEEPLEKLLQEFKPNCLVADMFFPWATDAAAKSGIPRLVFHGTSFFSLCAGESIRLYEPHKKVLSDSEPFVIPNLPGEIKITRKQLPVFFREEAENNFTKMIKASKESELKSFGVVVNSFYELEQAYADHYRNVLGRKAWHIGPVSLCNRGMEDKAQRGKEASIDEHECLKWLNSKKSNSVIYICFGSVSSFTDSQLKEIAIALEACGQNFIWVVRRNQNSERNEQEWLPEGYEKRMEGKGLIIRGWAPQMLILEHEATGGFVTHCGWNSTLEGVSAGKPMVTWPVSAEQFYNEKLVTEVLKIGIGVGAKEWVRLHGDYVKSEAIEKAISRVMEGEEAEEMRSRARKLGEMARQAVEEGGSSCSDFNTLIQELSCYHQLS
ncbi:scopoletin glucosyltransferase [Jatropha curcas]|uniref:scopoletin glucosyltransferase n=1 Tax=Jatropha curcas TaxID=180498 RepID=UPI0005FAF3D9|nr:scopoletin glucosyltransferase [Jatropha curcas]